MLHGVVVLDLSRVLAGPYATQLLVDLGARVIKVESIQGDDTRAWGPPFAGEESGYFLSVNRGKESLAVDLKREEGRALVQGLAGRADVLVENFKRGDLVRYGLDYAPLARTNPGLIYTSIRGFGEQGPRADQPGYDAALQALTGIMAMTGMPGAPPVKLGVAWIDVLTGLHSAVAILAALHERERTGRGKRLDLSLFEVGLASLVNQAQGTLISGHAPTKRGSAHPSIVPYQAFETADAPIMLTVGNDAQFARACHVLSLGELADDPRYRENRDRVEHRDLLVPIIQERLRTASRAVWLDRFRAANVSCTPVLDLAEALRDPQAEALGTIGHYEHPTAGTVPYVRSPLRHVTERGDRSESAVAAPDARPPRLGEHGKRIALEDLGLSDDAWQTLLAQGRGGTAKRGRRPLSVACFGRGGVRWDLREQVVKRATSNFGVRS